MKPCHGLLIAFEGVDGAGKTTQANNIVERFNTMGVCAVIVGYSNEDWFRDAYDSQPKYYDPEREIDFFAWAFNKLVERRIKPLLREDKVVIADRYSLSFFAYQSYHQQSIEILASRLDNDAPIPELTVILDLPPEVALDRCRQRSQPLGSVVQPFNLSDADRLFHVVEYYKRPYVGSILIDGQRSSKEVSDDIWTAVSCLHHR